jgi:cbb3-type cytochrome oxidase subunit 3
MFGVVNEVTGLFITALIIGCLIAIGVIAFAFWAMRRCNQ